MFNTRIRLYYFVYFYFTFVQTTCEGKERFEPQAKAKKRARKSELSTIYR